MVEAGSTEVASPVAGRARAARRLAIVVCALVGAAGLFVLQGNVRDAVWFMLQPRQEPDSYIDQWYPGYRDTIRWMTASGLQRIHSLPYDSSPKVHQRLMELMYPLVLVHARAEELPDGALVVVPDDVQLPRRCEQVFGSGKLKVLRVQE